jgi:hypothetical protein
VELLMRHMVVLLSCKHHLAIYVRKSHPEQRTVTLWPSRKAWMCTAAAYTTIRRAGMPRLARNCW